MICTATVTHDYHHYHPQGHAHQLISGMVVTPFAVFAQGGERQSIFKETSSSTAVSFISTFGELDNSSWCR